MNVGKSLKMAIAKRAVTQAYVANKLGCKPLWVSKLANKKKASSETVEKLAAALDMKASEFVALGED